MALRGQLWLLAVTVALILLLEHWLHVPAATRGYR
jgi:hypothetical protein